jgi:hypothetical protein
MVDAEVLPDGLRTAFHACQVALTREPPLRGEDAVRATVRKMSNHEADELAVRVVQLFAAAVREASRAETAQLTDELTLNAPATSSGARGKKKGVPQVVALYAAEA